MSVKEHPRLRLGAEDRRLVDLLANVLVDPKLHNDTRMRLHEEITEILAYAGRAKPSRGTEWDTHVSTPMS